MFCSIKRSIHILCFDCSIYIYIKQFTNWPGELVVIPCKFAEYDYGKLGYIKPADLAWHMNERGREPDNMMVFNKLDQNGTL